MMKAVRQTSRATVAPSEGEVSKNVMMEPQWSFVICRSTQIKICPRHHHSSPYRERVKKDWIDGRFSQLFWNTVKGISNRGSRMARDADKPRDRICFIYRCSAARLETSSSSSWAVRGLERTLVESRRRGSSNMVSPGVGVGWMLEWELSLLPDVLRLLSPSSNIACLTTLVCTVYCTTEKLELPFCCLELII